MPSVVVPSVIMASAIMPSVPILNAVMLSVIMLCVVMLSVTAPRKNLLKKLLGKTATARSGKRPSEASRMTTTVMVLFIVFTLKVDRMVSKQTQF
jgi:hypothetical protein